MVKNSPSNAGDMGSIPSWGTKTMHATAQLSLHATTVGSSGAAAKTQHSQNKLKKKKKKDFKVVKRNKLPVIR